jgi:ubiquinone/menaquinone biosynthesis C-methylase UbiE
MDKLNQYKSIRSIRRLYLSKKYLRGNGLEIGAMTNPLRVFNGAHVLYVDRKTVDELRSDYELRSDFPEIKNCFVDVDVVGDGEHLEMIRDNSMDFVIANHVLEHYEDPVKAIETAVRVLRPGGVLFLTVPDKRHTFDQNRSVTSLEHLIRDHSIGPTISREAHFRDAFDKTNYSLSDFEEFIAPYIEKEIEPGIIHYHVWTDKEIVELLSHMQKEIELGISILKVANSGSENIFIVKKVLRS